MVSKGRNEGSDDRRQKNIKERREEKTPRFQGTAEQLYQINRTLVMVRD